MTDDKDESWWTEMAVRDVTLSDGQTVSLNLTNWHWSVFDWMREELEFPARRIVEEARALEWGDGLSAALTALVDVFFERCEEEHGLRARP